MHVAMQLRILAAAYVARCSGVARERGLPGLQACSTVLPGPLFASSVVAARRAFSSDTTNCRITAGAAHQAPWATASRRHVDPAWHWSSRQHGRPCSYSSSSSLAAGTRPPQPPASPEAVVRRSGITLEAQQMVLRQLPAWPSLCNDTHTLASRLHALQQLFGQSGASQLLTVVPQAVTRVPTALEQQLQQLAHALGLNTPKDLLPLLCEAWHVTGVSLGDVQQRLGDVELLLGSPHSAWARQVVVGSSAWLLLDLGTLTQRLSHIAAALQVQVSPALAAAAEPPITAVRVRKALQRTAAAGTAVPSSPAAAGITPLTSVLMRPGAAALVATSPSTITARLRGLATLLQETTQVSPQAAEQQAVMVAQASPGLLLLQPKQVATNWARLQQRLPGLPPQKLLQLLAGSSFNMQRLEFLTEVAMSHTTSGSSSVSSSSSSGAASTLGAPLATNQQLHQQQQQQQQQQQGKLQQPQGQAQQQELDVYTALGLDEAVFLQRYPLYRPWEAAKVLVAAAPGRWGWAKQYTALQQAGSVAAWLQGLQGHWGTALSLACNPSVQQALNKQPSRLRVTESRDSQPGSSRDTAAAGHGHSGRGAVHNIGLQDLSHPDNLLYQLQMAGVGGDRVTNSVDSNSSGEAASFGALQQQWLLVPPSLQDMPDKQAWQLLAHSSTSSQRQAAVGAAVALAQQLLQYAAGVPAWQQQLVEWRRQAAAAVEWQHRQHHKQQQQQVGSSGHTAGSAASTTTAIAGSSRSRGSSSSSSDLHLRRQLWHQLQPQGSDGSYTLSPRLQRLHFLQHTQQQEACGLWEALVTSDKDFTTKFPVYHRWAQMQGWVQDKLSWKATFHEALQGQELVAWLQQLEQEPGKVEQLQYLVEAPGGQEWRGVGLLEAAGMPREQFVRMFPDAQYKAWRGIAAILAQLDPQLEQGGAVSTAAAAAAAGSQLTHDAITSSSNSGRAQQQKDSSSSSSSSSRRAGGGGAGTSSPGQPPVNREERVAQLQSRMQWLHEWGRRAPFWGEQLQAWSSRSWGIVLQIAEHRMAPRLEFLHQTGQEDTAQLLQQLRYAPAWFDARYPHFRLWGVVRNAAGATAAWKHEWEALRGPQLLQLLEEAAVELGSSSSMMQQPLIPPKQQQQQSDVAAQQAQSQVEPPAGHNNQAGSSLAPAAAEETGTAEAEGAGNMQGASSSECQGSEGSTEYRRRHIKEPASSAAARSLTPAVVQQVSHALRSRLRHLQHANLQQQPSPQQQQQQQQQEEDQQQQLQQGLPSLQQLLTLPQAQLVMQWPHRAVPSTRTRGNLVGGHGSQTARAVAGAPQALLGKEVVPPDMWNKLEPEVQQQLLARDAAVLRGLQTLAHTHGDWMEYLYHKATPRQWATMAQKYPKQQQRVAFLVRCNLQHTIRLVDAFCIPAARFEEWYPAWPVWREMLGLVYGVPHWISWLRQAEGAKLEVWLLKAEPRMGRLLWMKQNMRLTQKNSPGLSPTLNMSEKSFLERWPEYPGDSVMREGMQE